MSAQPPHHRPRAWVAAAVCTALFALTLAVLQGVYHYAWDEQFGPSRFDAGPLEWLLRTQVAFWGPGAFDVDRTALLGANAAGGGVLLVASYGLGWVGLRGLAWGSSRLSALLVLWAAVMLAAPLSQLTTLLLRYPEALTHDGSGQLVSGATVGAVFGLKWGWLAAAVGGVVWRRPASHRDEPPVTASAASDTLPGGEPTDAEPGAPTQSRSPRAPDAPGEAAAEGPGRQPR